MVQRKGGMRRKTRHKLGKDKNQRGKISIRKFVAAYNEGDRVLLKMESAFHKGVFHPNFTGKTGIVKKKVGDCYEVVINDFTKKKTLVVHPVHLTRC